ncbi:DUF1127 domain-containing protein [Vibrio aquaticus]|uniref:DUF1127 domain-containing protein n=1 Tax=Vibrio aquaticus TaxID=2496559 RepID=A0A3S0PN58_9VIBR|nr:DUF1127 domain-containing protein [Vibrio aquaticus]RTZ15219.1 DUF1127 domain-containing protein [Vibrio aquaticus]
METLEFSRKERLFSSCYSGKKILTKLKCWWRNFRTRKQLSNLPEHLLKDVGLTKEQAHQESIRHFWDE